jgi:hypothetical protein
LLDIGRAIEDDPTLQNTDLGRELKEEIDTAVMELPVSTKNEVMRRLSRFCAKLYKQAKPTAVIVLKKILDKLLDAGINLLPEMIRRLTP